MREFYSLFSSLSTPQSRESSAFSPSHGQPGSHEFARRIVGIAGDRHRLTLEGAGLIQPSLHVGIDVFRVGEVNLRHGKRGVTQPSSYIHQVNAVPQPSRRASLPQAMQIMLFANRPRRARNFRAFSKVIFSIQHHCLAVPTV